MGRMGCGIWGEWVEWETLLGGLSPARWGTAVAVSKNKNKNEKIKTNKNTKKIEKNNKKGRLTCTLGTAVAVSAMMGTSGMRRRNWPSSR